MCVMEGGGGRGMGGGGIGGEGGNGIWFRKTTKS